MEHTAQPPHHAANFAHPAGNVVRFGIENGMSVADFGAGSGHYVWPLAEAVGADGHVFAIDVQKDLLRRIHNEATRRGYTNVKILWADLEQPKSTKIADRKIDLVLMSNVLFQVHDKRALLAEAHRILKKTGLLVVIDWLDSFAGMGPHAKEVMTKEAAHTLILQAGFMHQENFSAGAHHWGVVARPVHL